jgi:glutamate 5-kinase
LRGLRTRRKMAPPPAGCALAAAGGTAPALRGGAMSMGGIAPALRGGAMSMTGLKDPRAALSSAKRIVVKIGSRAITQDGAFAALAEQVAHLMERGHTVVLVSSGAVAMGCRKLGLSARPRALPQLQAAAAVGQPRLLVAYEQAFAGHGIAVAQVLLTHADMADRRRYLNIRRAIDALTELRTLTIINENDTVATEEIEFGDNDQLAAMVAPLVGADLLVLLTDVHGLLDAAKERVSVVTDLAHVRGFIWQESNGVSLGGMASKVGAAERALQRGIPVMIAGAAEPAVLRRIVDGDDVGTLFLPVGAKLASRKYWIAYTLKMRGALVVDDGAARALVDSKRSLLPAGITAVRGRFRAGDAVTIEKLDGTQLARGLVRYDARDVRRLLGARSDEIATRLGHYEGDEIVHRDDLVVL